MFLTTRVLILTQNTAYAMPTVQALEKPGAFKVTPFTAVLNALSYLRDHPQDIIIADTALSGFDTVIFVQQVRAIQPDIAVILMPDTEQTRRFVHDLKLHGAIDTTWTARKLVPLLQEAQQRVYDALPGTAKMKPLTNEPAPKPQPVDDDTARGLTQATPKAAPPFEVLLTDEDGGETRMQVSQAIAPENRIMEDVDEAVNIFQRLAAEEPPMPGFEESGTVRELMHNLANAAQLSPIVEHLGEDTSPTPTVSDESHAIPATVILANTEGDSTPLDGFSLNEFLTRINDQMTETGRPIQPLPSWVEESEKYVREPDFLPDELAQLTNSQPLEYTAPTTTPSDVQLLEGEPGDIETELTAPVARSRPVTPEDMPVVAGTDADDEPPAEETIPPTVTQPPVVAPIFTHSTSDSPYVAQLALTLTQVSLELTAEATVLLQQGAIVAFAGALPLQDIEDIRANIGKDWEAAPTQGRIRFITLPSSGQDYMLYSRGVDGGFTLSMIFAGTLPLNTIRRQGKRLAEALLAIPEVEIDIPEVATEPETVTTPEVIAPLDTHTAIEIEPVEAQETGEFAPFTYLWLTRHATFILDNILSETITQGLSKQLAQRGWRIHALDVQEDYIYLHADLPGEIPAHVRIRDLMRRTTQLIQRVQPDVAGHDLWADSYLVLTPGRELPQDEIQEFIHFARS